MTFDNFTEALRRGPVVAPGQKVGEREVVAGCSVNLIAITSNGTKLYEWRYGTINTKTGRNQNWIDEESILELVGGKS